MFLGDMNAKTGCNNADLESVMGRQDLENMNDNGKFLQQKLYGDWWYLDVA